MARFLLLFTLFTSVAILQNLTASLANSFWGGVIRRVSRMGQNLPIKFTNFAAALLDQYANTLKNIVRPELIPKEYWKNIIWVAQDMRKAVCEGNKKSLNLLDTKHVTLLFVRPHGRFQLAFSLACDILSARKTLYHDPNFENQSNLRDSGRVLSSLTDMFIVHGLHHSVLAKIVSGATVPVFAASSDAYCLQKALSDMMTFYEKFSCLRGLTLAWVGPPNPTFNSYLVLCSQFGLNLRYTLICGYGAGRMSAVHAAPQPQPKIDNKDISLKEFRTAAETVEGANIVAIGMHPDERNKITEEILKKSNPGYVFMHSLPRGMKEVSNDIFDRENDLTWKTTENYLYIAMAIILTGLKEYTPSLPKPDL